MFNAKVFFSSLFLALSSISFSAETNVPVSNIRVNSFNDTDAAAQDYVRMGSHPAYIASIDKFGAVTSFFTTSLSGKTQPLRDVAWSAYQSSSGVPNQEGAVKATDSSGNTRVYFFVDAATQKLSGPIASEAFSQLKSTP